MSVYVGINGYIREHTENRENEAFSNFLEEASIGPLSREKPEEEGSFKVYVKEGTKSFQKSRLRK